MKEEKQNEAFSYHYSAKQQKEIETIRKRYVPAESKQGTEDKLERLRRLDAGVTRKGTVLSLILGVLSSLLLGIGMCCCMVFSQPLTDTGMDPVFVLGIVVGLLGILGVAMAYPLYNSVTKRERKKITPEILRLTDELLQ